MHDPTLWFLVQWFFRLEVQWLFRPEGIANDGADKPLIFEIYGDNAWHRSHILGDNRLQCFLGVTLRCLMRLTKAAELAKQMSEGKAAALSDTSITGEPTVKILKEAIVLKADLELGVSNLLSHTTCPQPVESVPKVLAEMNRLFQWAALIQLNRRVFAMQTSHPDIQGPVSKILESIESLNQENGVIAALLYPLAAAGCEIVQPSQRYMALEQCKRIELVGHTCVSMI